MKFSHITALLKGCDLSVGLVRIIPQHFKRPVKITFKEAHFPFTVYLKFSLCLFYRLAMRDFAISDQNLTPAGYNLIIKCLNPVVHNHGIHLQCLEHGKIQET